MRWTARVWDTGEYLSELTFGAEAEQRYGAPYLLMHRGDLHAALFSAVPPELIAYEKKLTGLEPRGIGRDAALRRRQQRSRRCRRRRRRRAFAGARDPARARETQVHGPGRASHGVPGRRCWEISSSTPAPSGGAPTGTSSIYPVNAQPRGALLRHQRARSRLGRGILVDARRDRRGPAGAGRLPRRRAARAGGLSRRAQVGAVRARSAAALGGRAGRAAGRRLPSDDALHGAGRGQRAGGRCRALPLPGRDRRPGRRLPAATRRPGSSAPRASS